MGKASSAKKIARMAEKGKGKKIRFQGGTVFPLTVLLVSVLGLALIVYARSSTQALAVPPQASKGDHWHVAFGVYACNDWLPNISGNKEGENGQPDEEYLALGVHSHDDGVIHYHPFSSASSGRNAKLARFLDVYDIGLSDTKLEFPEDQGGAVYEEGVTKCTNEDGEEVDGVLRLAVWPDATKPDDFQILTRNMADARIDRNGMAMAIFFTPEDTPITEPPTASQLEALGAVDSGATSPTATTVAGTATTVAGTATTGAGTATTVAGSVAPASASETTVAGSGTTTADATTTTSG